MCPKIHSQHASGPESLVTQFQEQFMFPVGRQSRIDDIQSQFFKFVCKVQGIMAVLFHPDMKGMQVFKDG